MDVTVNRQFGEMLNKVPEVTLAYTLTRPLGASLVTLDAQDGSVVDTHPGSVAD